MGQRPRFDRALLVLAVAGSLVVAQEVPPAEAPPAPPAAVADAKPQVKWLGQWSEVLRQARAEKRPLLVLFHGDGDEDADAAAAKLWHEEKLVEKSRAFLCVLASASKHDELEDEAGARHCKRWGAGICVDHQQALPAAAGELIGGAEPLLPQLVICTGEGRVLARRAFALKEPELLKLMDQALRVVGVPGGAGPADPKADAARTAEALADAKKARSGRKTETLKPALELGGEAARAALLDYARKGDDDATRVAVIEALAARGDYLVLEALQKLAKEKQEIIALAAIDALGTLRLPEAKDELKKALAGFTGNDQGRVLRALAACGPADASVHELLVKKVKGTDQNIRAHALIAMSSMKPTPDLEALLKKAIFDRLTVARACAIYAAGKGRYEACREELAKQAAGETHVDLKELAGTALAHLDHEKDDPKCCDLDASLSNFVQLGDSRR